MKYLIIVSLSICFFSCKKSDSPAPTTPTTMGDSTTLLKLIVIDSTKASPFDTTAIYKFDYDNSKRISKTTALAYNSTTLQLETQYTFTYSYTGSDTLPSKVVEYNHPSNATFTLNWTHDLTYDSQSRLLKDSSNDNFTTASYNNISIYTNKYVYQSDGYIDSAFQYLPAQAPGATRFVSTKDANNNITRQQTYNTNPVTEVVYDSYTNPLYKTIVKEPYLLNAIYPTFFSGINLTPQKNNFSKISTNTYDASGTTIVTSYSKYFITTYNANALPSTMGISANPPTGPLTDKYKYLFVYTKL